MKNENKASVDRRDFLRKAGLGAVGAGAGQLRRLGLTHADEEVRDQSRVLLRRIEKEKSESPRLATAAARLLRERKPDGCLPVLLAYLPFAHELRDGDLDSDDCGHHPFDQVSRCVGHCPRVVPLFVMFARQRFYV